MQLNDNVLSDAQDVPSVTVQVHPYPLVRFKAHCVGATCIIMTLVPFAFCITKAPPELPRSPLLIIL